MTKAVDVVELVYSPVARQAVVLKISLVPELLADEQTLNAMTVKDVIVKSGLLERFPELDIATVAMGIWGRKTTLSTVVCANDRIEIYRKLLVDPKEARRLRYKKQGPVSSRCRPGYKGP